MIDLLNSEENNEICTLYYNPDNEFYLKPYKVVGNKVLYDILDRRSTLASNSCHLSVMKRRKPMWLKTNIARKLGLWVEIKDGKWSKYD